VSVSWAESIQSARAVSALRAAFDGLPSLGYPLMAAMPVGADVGSSGHVLRRRVQRGQGPVLGVVLHEGELAHHRREAIGVVVQAGGGDAGMSGDRAHSAAGRGEPALELECEQEVGQLGVAVGAEVVVGALLPVEVVEVQVAEAVQLGGDRHDPIGDAGEQQVGQGERSEVVDADLGLPLGRSPVARECATDVIPRDQGPGRT
jgi:hypothetical protein